MTADIIYASGAVHDDIGPITSFVPMTPAGREWLAAWASVDDCYVIETSEVPLVIHCIEREGLTVRAA